MFIKKVLFLLSSTYSVKILHKLSSSFLSIALTCIDFLYDLSKELIDCWSFSYSFLYLSYLLMIILCKTFHLMIDCMQYLLILVK